MAEPVVRHLEGDTRKPVQFATYSRDPGEEFLGEIVGPNLIGEHLVVIETVVHPDGRTRVGFAYATVDDVSRAFGLTEEEESA